MGLGSDMRVGEILMDSASASSRAVLAEIDARLGIVHLISGRTHDQRDFYAYLSIQPSHYEDFVRASQGNAEMNLLAFGDVLKKGLGGVPPEDVRREMEEKFGVQHVLLRSM